MGAIKTMKSVNIQAIIRKLSSAPLSDEERIFLVHGLKLAQTSYEGLSNSGLISGDSVHRTDMQMLCGEVGGRLKSLRVGLGINQIALVQKSGVSQSTISKIETGSRMPTPAEAKKLAKALKTTPEFIIAGKK